MFFVDETIKRLLKEFEHIPAERRGILSDLSTFIDHHNPANLVFICTHNSRRSHIAQIWAQTAASHFNVSNVNAFSGGTEATAFNPRAVDALRGLGFRIDLASNGTNPRYVYSDTHPAFEVFSKKYDDAGNPVKDFAAVMTCSHADENCPVVVGASARISLPFDDPKDFDGTDIESIKYTERSLEIGREILFAFSQIRRQ